MKPSILIAGIGNIFQGDDAFGVAVAQNLLQSKLPENVRVVDFGIRAIDLGFALLDNYDVTILIDAVSRGGAPGTVYTIEIDPNEIAGLEDDLLVNSHALDPVRVLMQAKSMGARFKRVLLIGCEPLVLDRDEDGHIGLSDAVSYAVGIAAATVRELIGDFDLAESTKKDEVCLK